MYGALICFVCSQMGQWEERFTLRWRSQDDDHLRLSFAHVASKVASCDQLGNIRTRHGGPYDVECFLPLASPIRR